MKTAEYYIKEVNNRFEIAKFDGGKTPENVYTVDVRAMTCNCEGARMHYKKGHEEKHVKMVTLWLAVGRPDPWTWNKIRKIENDMA